MSDIFSMEEPSLDLTPLIDTVFLLLIFFIMATTFAEPVLEVALSEASSAAAPERKERLALTIDAEGKYHHGQAFITLEDWRELLANAPKDMLIVFNVDRNAPFNAFVSGLDAAKGQGRENILINAAQPGQDNPK